MANELREMRQRAAKVGDAFLLFEQQQREAADRYAAFLVEVDAAKAAIAAAKRDALAEIAAERAAFNAKVLAAIEWAQSVSKLVDTLTGVLLPPQPGPPPAEPTG